MKETLIAKIESRTSAIANMLGIIERQRKSLTVLIEQITDHEIEMRKHPDSMYGDLHLKGMQLQRTHAERQLELDERRLHPIIARHRSDIAGFTRELAAIKAAEERAIKATITATMTAIDGPKIEKGKQRRYVDKGERPKVKKDQKPKKGQEPAKGKQAKRGGKRMDRAA